MNSYLILIFFHVSGAVGMFAAWGIEAATLSWLRQATTVQEARLFVHRLKKQLPLAPGAMILVLGTGIWMMADRWGPQSWMIAAFIALIFMIVIGIVTLRRIMSRIHEYFAGNPQNLSTDFRSWITGLAASLRMRVAIGVGIIGLMTVKSALPGTIAIMSTALGVGLIIIFCSRRSWK